VQDAYSKAFAGELSVVPPDGEIVQ